MKTDEKKKLFVKGIDFLIKRGYDCDKLEEGLFAIFNCEKAILIDSEGNNIIIDLLVGLISPEEVADEIVRDYIGWWLYDAPKAGLAEDEDSKSIWWDEDGEEKKVVLNTAGDLFDYLYYGFHKEEK